MRSGGGFVMGRVPPEALLMASVALLLVLHAASSQRDFHFRKQPKKDPLADFLSQTAAAIREATEALLGPELMHFLAEILPTLSSAISELCFVLSRVSARLLDAVGLEGDYLSRGLKLSPDEVQVLLLWGLGALVAYWMLALLGQGLKLLLFLVAFVVVVRSVLELFRGREEEPWEAI
ncbi:transmembrane protein 109-like [Antechinus flavipes]|uniref:transmembrane protein 109-like n=1 Tax=Antechinus flavipes TaxID=38775 RepID=UPI0022368C2D|nr:transmembrane protein 109-like [Antechinus flavipes]